MEQRTVHLPAKRPTTAQIAARQRIIIEGIADSGLTRRQAARKFSVTPRELERFLGVNAKSLRREYNRSGNIRQMYAEGTRHEVKRELGLRYLPHRYEYEPQRIAKYAAKTGASLELRERKLQVASQIQRVYYKADTPQSIWADYTARMGVPSSTRLIRKLLEQGKITASKYRIVMHAHSIIYAKAPKVA